MMKKSYASTESMPHKKYMKILQSKMLSLTNIQIIQVY